jgi:hypothetical protein
LAVFSQFLIKAPELCSGAFLLAIFKLISECSSHKRSDFRAEMDHAYLESLHQLLQLSAWKPSQLMSHLEAR